MLPFSIRDPSTDGSHRQAVGIMTPDRAPTATLSMHIIVCIGAPQQFALQRAPSHIACYAIGGNGNAVVYNWDDLALFSRSVAIASISMPLDLNQGGDGSDKANRGNSCASILQYFGKSNNFFWVNDGSFNSAGRITFCDSTGVDKGGDGASTDRAGRSCLQLRNSHGRGSGSYHVLDSEGRPYKVWCENTFAGGERRETLRLRTLCHDMTMVALTCAHVRCMLQVVGHLL